MRRYADLSALLAFIGGLLFSLWVWTPAWWKLGFAGRFKTPVGWWDSFAYLILAWDGMFDRLIAYVLAVIVTTVVITFVWVGILKAVFKGYKVGESPD